MRFAVCSCYGHHRNPATARRDYRGQIDYFAVYCPETAGVYLIPIGEINVQTACALRVDPPRNNQHDGVRYAAPYEIGRIPIDLVARQTQLTTAGLAASAGAR